MSQLVNLSFVRPGSSNHIELQGLDQGKHRRLQGYYKNRRINNFKNEKLTQVYSKDLLGLSSALVHHSNLDHSPTKRMVRIKLSSIGDHPQAYFVITATDCLTCLAVESHSCQKKVLQENHFLLFSLPHRLCQHHQNSIDLHFSNSINQRSTQMDQRTD